MVPFTMANGLALILASVPLASVVHSNGLYHTQ